MKKIITGEKMKSGTFNNRGVSINYYQTGKGETDLLFHHGLYDDGLCWGFFPRDLGKRHRITLMDARGFGLSSHPESGYDMDTMAEDMAALIKHLGLIQPVVIGHSMGASLGCHLAALYPELTGGVVLIDPAFREYSGSDMNAELMAKRVSELLSQQAMPPDELKAAIIAKHPDWPSEFIDPAVDSKYRMSIKALAVLNSISATWEEDLVKASCPMLLITADVELGAIVSKETVDFVCKKNSHVQPLYISGAGHIIHREKYAAVLKGIENFLIKIGYV
jgi:pimeloyl-ACP methyl ester carboxylesterase